MDGRQTDYPQSGLSSPYPSFPEPHSEGSSADQASAAQYPHGQDPRSSNFSSSATPTSDYGLNPSSARSGSFPEYIQRGQNPYSGQGPNAGGMAQAQSPSISLQDGQASSEKFEDGDSNHDVPIDPSIATSPTYPPHPNYSPYPPQHDMHQYQGHPATPVYARPDWGNPQYPPAPHGMHPQYMAASSGPPQPSMVSPVPRPPGVGSPDPVSAAASAAMYALSYPAYSNGTQGGHPLSTVYSFVPIPGAQQHKRPRRRYEEIERMYKCGWNGCEKAYGTLNHLNAHVTMQSHGQKRTPEEFKEIRKEWKAKKKEEEAARKAEDERLRQADSRSAAENPQEPVYGQIRGVGPPPQMGGPQLPPIGYAPAGASGAPSQYPTQSPQTLQGMAEYAAGGQIYNPNNGSGGSSNYPQSPYAPGQPIYQQPNDNGQGYQQ
ncbi:hypothetical protein H2201_005548 [Coniosporium apollinis]|uniref:C2H2-type domain-containing protein n=1 Tax=Coniosporium apollinis TaxID=61459 RepID=A0ABQ9NSU2_9PEZI|nr:hypothetical protein H2201_005548 [Coniosporium apollinis]